MMPNQEYVLAMARYNHWQNESLLEATSTLSDADRKKDRGAFFGSIQKTFSHLLWADMIWMHRFAGTTSPQGGIDASGDLINDWTEFVQSRGELDQSILTWAHGVKDDAFAGELRWFSGALGREITKPWSIVILHFFNHQTHHRGQIHAMLTAAGAKPGATDIPFMPKSYSDM